MFENIALNTDTALEWYPAYVSHTRNVSDDAVDQGKFGF